MIATAKKSLVMAALLASTSALAATPDWRVSEVSGSVTVERSGKVLNARQDTTLRPGDVIRTGGKGRAVLVRGKEFVVVSPDAQLKVAVPEESGPVIQFFQYLGNALFKIEKKSTPHFGVKTPYLAAVVKGTTFNVSVGADRSSVQVTEGTVEVATGDDLEAALITPGLIGFVDADDASELLVISGNRSGEDLSNAIVRGTPEFVATPPQARGSRDSGRRMPGASGLTPAVVRANRVETDNPALASAAQPVSLALFDDAVSGGEAEPASFNAQTGADQNQPDAVFNQETVISDAGDSPQGAASQPEPQPEPEPAPEPETEPQDEPAVEDVNPIDPTPGDEGEDAAGQAPAANENDGSGVEQGVDDSDADDTDTIDVEDGNNGHGNDDDGDDDSNPGQGNVSAGVTSGSAANGQSGVVFGGGTGGGDEADGSGVEVDIDTGNDGNQVDVTGGADGGLVYAEDQDNGSCAGIANCSGGAKPEDGNDDADVDVDLDLGVGTDDEAGDGNNGHGNDEDGVDESNPGKGKGKSAGDEADGSGVELDVDDGESDDSVDIDVGDDLDLDLDDGGDDGNNGHGNDDDGNDDSNPGKGKGRGHGKGGGNGNGNGNGHGNGHGGDD